MSVEWQGQREARCQPGEYSQLLKIRSWDCRPGNPPHVARSEMAYVRGVPDDVEQYQSPGMVTLGCPGHPRGGWPVRDPSPGP